MSIRFRAIFIFCLLVLFPSKGFGQQNQRKKIDSIYHLLQGNIKSDSNRVRLLNNYARMIRFDSMAKAMTYADEALLLARKISNEYWAAQSIYSKGMIALKQNKYDQSMLYFDSALILFEEINGNVPIANTLNFKAEIFQQQGKLANAIDVLHDVIRLSEKTGNKREEGIAYGNIGVVYSDLGMHQESKDNYKKAGQSFRQLNDTMLLGLAMQNIAYAEYKLKEYANSIVLYDSAIILFKAVNRKDAALFAQAGLALVLANINQFDRGIAFLKETIRYCEQANNRRMLAGSLVSLGRVIDLAIDSAQGSGYNYDTALYYVRRGLSIAKEIGDIRNQSFGWLFISEIYGHLKDHEHAYEAHINYTLIKDSLSGIHKTQEVAIKELQFETEKKQALMQAEISSQRLTRKFIIAFTVLVIIASLAFFILYMRRQKTRLKLREAELQAHISDTEMKALRAQMNPHFIFNSLNSINIFISKNKSDLAQEYLVKFAKLMRLVLENSEKKEVSLANDLQALEWYMQLELKRMDNKFSYEISVDEDIDKENTFVPPLLFQPFVENSIWHGIAPKQGNGHITIRINRSEDMICCVIEDDGVGRKKNEESTVNEKKSMGMKITHDRIVIMNKIKKANAMVTVADRMPGTHVEIKLPLQPAF